MAAPGPAAAGGKEGRDGGRMLLVCYLCSRQFGTQSLGIHVAQCYDKRMTEWERTKPVYRGPRPADPVDAGVVVVGGNGKLQLAPGVPTTLDDQEAVDAWNEVHTDMFMELRPTCDKCGRGFNVDALMKHRPACKGTGVPQPQPVKLTAEEEAEARERYAARQLQYRKEYQRRAENERMQQQGGPGAVTEPVKQALVRHGDRPQIAPCDEPPPPPPPEVEEKPGSTGLPKTATASAPTTQSETRSCVDGLEEGEGGAGGSPCRSVQYPHAAAGPPHNAVRRISSRGGEDTVPAAPPERAAAPATDEARRCPVCLFADVHEAKFCSECGVRLPNAMNPSRGNARPVSTLTMPPQSRPGTFESFDGGPPSARGATASTVAVPPQPQQQQPQQNGAWSAAASPQQEPALAEAPSPEHRVCSGNSMRSRFTNGTYVRFSHTPHDDMVQFDGDSLHNAAALYSRNAEVVSCSSVRSPVPSFTTGGSPGSEIDLAVPTRAGLAFDAKCEFFSQGGGDDMVLRANFEAVPSGGEPAHPARPESTAVPLPPAAVPVQHPRGDAGYSPTVKPPKNPAAALTSPEGDHGGHAFTHSSGTAAPTTTTTTTTTPSRGGTSTATGSACAPAPGGKPASSGSKASWKAPSVEHDGDADLPEVDTAFTPPFRLNKKHPAAEREGDAAARGRVRALSGGALAKAAEAPGRIGYSPTVRTQVVPAGLADASAVVNTEEGPAGDDEGEDEEEAEDDGEGAPERARPAMLDDTMKLDAEANQAAAAAAYMPDDEEEDEEFEEESEADDGGHSPHDGAPQPEALFERSAAAVAAVGEAPGASRPRQHSNHQPRPFVDDAPIFKMRKSLHDTVNSAHGATTSSQDTAATEPMAPPAVHKTQVLTDEEDGGDAGDVGLRPTRPRQESDWESAGVTRGVSPVFKFRRNMNRPVPSSSVDDASASLASTLAQSRVDDRSCVVASLDEQGFVASLNEQGFAECVQSAEAAAEEDTGAGVETDSAAPRRRSSHRGSVLHCTTCGHPNQRNTRGVVRFCRACGSMIVASPRPAKTQASPPPPPAAVVSKCAVGAEGAEGGVPMPIAHGLLGAKDDMGEEETLDENIAREKDVCVDEAEQGCKDDVALEEVADDVEDGLPAYADSADNDSAEADEPCDAAGADPDVFQHVKDAIADAEPPQDEHGWYPTMPEDADDAADDDTAAADDAPHGAPVPVFECPGCGVLVRYGVRFCKECGTGLAGVGMASAEEEEEDEDADDDEGRVESAAAAVHPAPQPAAPDGGPADASAPPPAAPPAALVEGEAPPEGDDAKRVPCEWCGRAFLQDRLEKHEPICKKHTLKKREREMLKAHKEQEKQRQNPAKPAPKTTWREKTSQLRAAMKNARAVDRALKAGKDLKDIPQAPPDEHDDRVTCPHCHRKFAQQAADRHIPLCATMKSRPRPVKKPAARPRGGGGGGGGGGGDAGQCIAEQEQNLQDLVTVRRRDMEENLVRARNDMKRVTAERDAPWTPGGAGPPTKVKHFKDRFRIKDPQQLPAFPCPYCGYRAVNTQSLEVHLKTCGLGKAGVAAVHNQALEARVRALERLVTAADTAPPQAPKSIGAAPASSSSQSAEQQLATTTDIKSALEQAKQNVMQLERKLVDREKAKGAGEGGGGATPPLPPPPLDGGGDSGRDGPPPPPAPAPAPSSARKSVHFAEEGEGGASSAPTPLAGACARAPMAQRKPVAKHPLRSQAEGLRYSNMVSRLYDDEIKSAGAGGPPAAKAKNPDDSRTQCPYCGRKFAGAVAQRHIPKCAATASFVPPSTKKPPVNKQGGAEPRSRS